MIWALLACGGGPELPADVGSPVRLERPGYTFDRPGNWSEAWTLSDDDATVRSAGGGCSLIVVSGPADDPERDPAEWLNPSILAFDQATEEPLDRWGALTGVGVLRVGVRNGRALTQLRFVANERNLALAWTCPTAELDLTRPGLDLIRDSIAVR